ncbi:MAG: ribosome-binding protein aMBF1 (putative translation factor) [Halieaceae bacterium]|jgi:ribosome-binding protein aMBF1 (putative translation factor)
MAKKKSQDNSAESEDTSLDGTPLGSFIDGMTDIAASAIRVAINTREVASDAIEQATAAGQRVGKSIDRTPDQLRIMADAGESLRDMREVAGLTLADLSSALLVRDKSFLKAVEDGREALSLELILRMASLYARNDPIPFATKYIRTYRPQLWETLEGWGLDKLPIQIEREREFLNIYRSKDAARQLSNEGFAKVLGFTQQAFDLALHFVAEEEAVSLDTEDTADSKTTPDA